MIGLAVVFHVISALALIVLVLALLQIKMQRDTVRRLIEDVQDSGKPRRVWVGVPVKLIGRVAFSLGIPVEGKAAKEAAAALVKVDFEPFMELFLLRGVSLLRWTTQTDYGPGILCGLDLILPPGTTPLTAEEIAKCETKLKAAFGATIDVRLVLS